MNANLTISVVMPLYNAERTVKESILSVLNQTFRNFELIVVDDQSTDSGASIARGIASIDSRIKVISLLVNSGAGVARNVAMEKSSGRYVAFLDADDLWVPDKLQIQLDFMQANGYAFTCTAYQIQEFRSSRIVGSKTVPLKIEYRDLLYENSIGCLTVMFDTEILGPRKMPKLRKRQDFALWLDILKDVNCYPINKVLSIYRIMPNSISHNKIEMIWFNFLMFRECEKMSRVSAFYYVFCNVFRKLLRTIYG